MNGLESPAESGSRKSRPPCLNDCPGEIEGSTGIPLPPASRWAVDYYRLIPTHPHISRQGNLAPAPGDGMWMARVCRPPADDPVCAAIAAGRVSRSAPDRILHDLNSAAPGRPGPFAFRGFLLGTRASLF